MNPLRLLVTFAAILVALSIVIGSCQTMGDTSCPSSPLEAIRCATPR